MKNVFQLLVCICFLSFCYLDEVYSISLNDIDGNPVNMSNYRGKKVLFVILPLSQSDTSVSATELADIEEQYDSTLIVIGVPAVEYGYASQNKQEVKSLYSGQHSNFILTEGMKVTKNSGSQQAAIFQWMTNKDRNKHFEQDVLGIGHKFFVDEQGVLYAVMGPQIKLSSEVISRILSKQIPR